MRHILYSLLSLIFYIFTSTPLTSSGVVRVPSPFRSIREAVNIANPGDTILIAPGNYHENGIHINKPLVITSEWIRAFNDEIINHTVLDGDNESIFIIASDDVTICGLKIINGDHSISVSSDAVIRNNHFVNNRDAISMEGGSGGYIGYNLIENDRDDGIDSDIGDDSVPKVGSNVIIENNTIINSNDDGIEIRLFTRPGQNIEYDIRNNVIMSSGNAGIQLISYDTYTGKVFLIANNYFRNCKVGVGCMPGGLTVENLQGAPQLDEPIFLIGNTMVDNQLASTGGNRVVAVNNLVCHNALGSFYRFGSGSKVLNNIFYGNGKNLQSSDLHLLDSLNSYDCDPLTGSAHIIVEASNDCMVALPPTVIARMVDTPEINVSGSKVGADTKYIGTTLPMPPLVEAGKLVLLKAPENKTILNGKVWDPEGKLKGLQWKMEDGPGKMKIGSPFSLNTEVMPEVAGIYTLSLSGRSPGDLVYDNTTLKYYMDGRGISQPTGDKDEIIIDPFSFAYSYVSTGSRNAGGERESLLLQEDRTKAGVCLEYLLDCTASKEYILSIRALGLTKESEVSFSFDGKEIGEIEMKISDHLSWFTIPKPFKVTPGHWSLTIGGVEGSVVIDKILLRKN